MRQDAGTRRTRRPVAVDVFAGVGGLSLGFEQAGFDVVCAIEYDSVHAATYRYNFPLAEVMCRDVRRVGASDVLAAARRGWRGHHPTGPAWDGIVDVLIGGPSCQGFSIGGVRDIDDMRNELLVEFIKLVETIRPRAFCLENVPGLLEPRYASLRDDALGRLRVAGYSIYDADTLVNAADHGVPQVRRRLLVLGTLDGEIPELALQVSSPPTVAQALDGIPDPSLYQELWTRDTTRLTERDLHLRLASVSSYARVLAGLDADPGDLSRARKWDPGLLTNSLLTRHAVTSIKRFAETPPGGDEPVSRYHRLRLDGQARTLRAGTGRERGSFTSPRPIHPILPRVITVREAARLHSFPDWFRFHATNWHGHRQIGNSVPPLLARVAALRIAAALDVRPANVRRVLDRGDDFLIRLSQSEASRVFAQPPDEVPPSRRRKQTRSDQASDETAAA